MAPFRAVRIFSLSVGESKLRAGKRRAELVTRMLAVWAFLRCQIEEK